MCLHIKPVFYIKYYKHKQVNETMNRIRKLLHIDDIHKSGYTGKNIGIAILDTGIVAHPDLTENIVCFQDYINGKRLPYDDNGHGTHVSGIIAGTGKKSNGLYRGIAPNANIIMLKCLEKSGNGSVADAKRCFDFILSQKERYQIRIVNISVGSVAKAGDRENESLIEGVEYLWQNGLVVVIAAGNNGPEAGSVTAPGCAKSVITVGASDDNLETGSPYTRNNKKMLHYSGRGPTDICVVKPEIVCPGTGVVSCDIGRKGYSPKSGTSMAAPIVSGVIALLLEKYPDMTNKDVKKRLYETSEDLGFPKSHQGWGRISPKTLLK